MNFARSIDTAIVVLAALMATEKLWKYWMVARFFRAHSDRASAPSGGFNLPPTHASVTVVSILQPILSGDPTLASCLEQNLRFQSRFRRETLWLVDEDDLEARQICTDLIARYPDADVSLLLTPPPPDRCSPKTFKLIVGAERVRGEYVCVLDDDTMLPDGALEICLPFLDRPGVGLAFGLPYYVNFSNFWSSLVSCFVNANSLLTYIPTTYLCDPFTINGMFFAVKRSCLDAVGGFRGLETEIMDDFAIARRFRSHGYRLAQTPLMHGISTQVDSSRHYFRLLQRWFTFPRETVLKALPVKQLVIVYGLGLVALLLPLVFVLLLLARFSPGAAGLLGGTMAFSFAIFWRIQTAYLPRPTPWRAYWMAPVLQLLLPLQALAALGSPQTIVWRGHHMQIEPGGRFRFIRRRPESRPS